MRDFDGIIHIKGGDTVELWQILQQAMKEREYKVADVAHICGLPDSTVRGIITRRQKSIALDVAFRLSRGLGIPLEVLAGEAAAKNEPPAGPEGQTGGKITLEESNKRLEALGYFQEGAELSDRDLAFLGHVIGLLDSWFGQRQ